MDCPLCGSYVSRGASDCAKCGAQFQGDKVTPVQPVQTPPANIGNPKAAHEAYLASGFCFCLSSSILVGFPLGAVVGNSVAYWVIASAVLFAVSYGFTLLRKGPMLTELNFLGVTAFLLLASAATMVSSRGGTDWFAVPTLGAFTLGLPILVAVVTLVWHARRCLNYPK